MTALFGFEWFANLGEKITFSTQSLGKVSDEDQLILTSTGVPRVEYDWTLDHIVPGYRAITEASSKACTLNKAPGTFVKPWRPNYDVLTDPHPTYFQGGGVLDVRSGHQFDPKKKDFFSWP